MRKQGAQRFYGAFLSLYLLSNGLLSHQAMAETFECVLLGQGGVSKRGFTRVPPFFVELIHVNPQAVGEHFNQITFEIVLETSGELKLSGRDNLFMHRIDINKKTGFVIAKADALDLSRPRVELTGSCVVNEH